MKDIDCGIGFLDEDNFITPIVTESVSIDKPTVHTILSCFESGLGLDVAKNHTGVALWDGLTSTLDLEGFAIDYEYDKSDYMAEFHMRKWFKTKLSELLGGKHFEVCVIENVYGGESFDTTRKLLALNTVIDELIDEGVCTVDKFYRLLESEWYSDFRKYTITDKGLDVKYATQLVLKELDLKFVIDNENLSTSEKEAIYYEDKCDAVAMLCSLAIRVNSANGGKKKKTARMSEVVMYYIEEYEDIYQLKDSVINSHSIETPDFNQKSLEKTVLRLASEYKDSVVCIYVETKSLGTFGIRNKLKFYSQGYGYLVFYNKSIKKRC